MYLRDMIWEAVYELLEEDEQRQMCLYEGIKKWETEVKDIVDSIEDLAGTLAHAMAEKNEYEQEREKGDSQ